MSETATPLGERFVDALAYAARLHRQQTRKGTAIPYVGHLLAVASLVIEDGGDEDEAIAALLHDAAEDHGGAPRLADIRARFGPRVAGIVEACSDSLAADPRRKAPWRARKSRLVRHLETAGPDVLRVACADKLHNARAILDDYRALGEPFWRRFNAERDDVLWYLRSVAGVLGRRGPARLAAELRRVVGTLDRLVATRTRAATAPPRGVARGNGRRGGALPDPAPRRARRAGARHRRGRDRP